MKNINEKTEMVPVDRLKRHPRNPRRGNVDAIKDSIDINGWYGSLIVQRNTGHILVGNHRYEAAKAAGAESVSVTWVDIDNDQALRIMLADNRASDVAENDTEALVEILNALDGLQGTIYSQSDLDELMAQLDYSAAIRELPDEFEVANRETVCPNCGHTF